MSHFERQNDSSCFGAVKERTFSPFMPVMMQKSSLGYREVQFSVLILFFPKDTHLGSSANFGVSIFLVNRDDEFVSLMSMRVGGLGATFIERRSRRK